MWEESESLVVIPAIIIALGATFLCGYVLSRTKSRWSILDHPNSRSLHSRSVPRTGGIAILIGIVLGIFICCATTTSLDNRSEIFFLSIGLLPLMIVSLFDDYCGVSAKWRLLVHFVSATIFITSSCIIHSLDVLGFSLLLPTGIASIFSVLFIVWMINLYNFMDGMDGFAGGMAAIGFATFAWLGRENGAFAVFCWIVTATNLGFLIHNFPPAKIFLGDVGSTTLGFLAAGCTLWSSQAGLFPFWIALLIFSPFIVDATVTLLLRLWRGAKVWEAHRSHYYQRLVLLGWSHRRTVLVEYTLMLACAGSALWAVNLLPVGQMLLAMSWGVIYGLSLWGVQQLEQRRATVTR